jgi:YHS domain-containing protein
MRHAFLAAAASLIFAAAPALAGEQYMSEGYAVSGYDVVAYHDIEQADVGTPQPKAVRGSPAFQTEYNGAKWLFSSAANRDAFLAQPEKYAPAFDGHCAFGVARGGKVPGNPHLWRIVDGKLYLNITRRVAGFWEKDIPGNISTAGSNWTMLEAAPASQRTVPPS